MPGTSILVVEDEPDILELVTYNLRKAGFEVTGVGSGEAAISLLAGQLPDLVILDLMLPGISGTDVCRRIKNDESMSALPIIMLTAKTSDEDIISGLDVGADDYVTKPFSPKVLIARTRAVLRRNIYANPNAGIDARAAGTANRIKIHDIEIDEGRHEVYCRDKRVELSATEFRILSYLASHPGWVFSRSKIIGGVKGDDYPVTDRSVDVQILGIRKKLGDCGKSITTVRGVGYKIEEEKRP